MLKLEVEVAELRQQLGRMQELERELEQYRWALACLCGWVGARACVRAYARVCARQCVRAWVSLCGVCLCTQPYTLLNNFSRPGCLLPSWLLTLECRCLAPCLVRCRQQAAEQAAQRKGSGIWGYISGQQ